MNWMSDLEVRITAQTPEDARDLREVMNPYGVKKIVIEKCGLRLEDIEKRYGKPVAEDEIEKQLERNRLLKEKLDEITNSKEAVYDTLHS